MIARIPLPERRVAWRTAMSAEFASPSSPKAAPHRARGEDDRGRTGQARIGRERPAIRSPTSTSSSRPDYAAGRQSRADEPGADAPSARWLKTVYLPARCAADLGDEASGRFTDRFNAIMGSSHDGAVLYHGEPNGPSLSVLAALEESGLDIETRPIDLLEGERHTLLDVTDRRGARRWRSRVKARCCVIDGEAMSEAVFLAQYFDEAGGGCGLQPKDPYAHWQMLMWCRQATERLSPAVAYLGIFATRRQAGGMDEAVWRGSWTASKAKISAPAGRIWRDGTIDDAKAADSRAKIAQFAERAENQLADGRGWLMGEFSDRRPRNLCLAWRGAAARTGRLRWQAEAGRVARAGRRAAEREEGAGPRATGRCPPQLRAGAGNQSLGMNAGDKDAVLVSSRVAAALALAGCS